ncbi:type I polyketide synthase [Paenibacillus monticola]|uniref:SDR family oxidoreductase n=1 Tax=Paenibacillus monticola TaxID=2666075 RepID=A0A7X2HBG5_9BACL|nr:type I polyketide synthase [Paenibacillus monticola]MRN57058.1 SDR family oxidoreductase [Paenibacillus monticola]
MSKRKIAKIENEEDRHARWNSVSDERTGLEIAVIGMSGRFPKAKNIQEFWENLRGGVDALSTFTDEELLEFGVDPELLSHPDYVKKKGSLDAIEDFDASFFGYTPKEASYMDPQLRLFHEICYQALEDAGYANETYKGRIGLYAGNTQNLFWMGHLLPHMQSPNDQFEIVSLNDSNTFSTRVAYKLNLRGPALTVQTACSTSLVAIHLASQSLIAGECNMALAGGASVVVPRKNGYLYAEGMLLSKSGACRAFDEEADGLVFGDGAGCVVLKMLDDAIQDGDHIYAVVKGTAVNNDGNLKAGYTAPSSKGQMIAIRSAHHVAEVDPETITYVETHGAGSTLGDPIEFEGLKLAFNSDKKGFCALGSAKTNTGHLNQAAGVTGFIKTVLSLYNKELVPALHFKKANPKIDFENSPFYVNTELKQWERTWNTPLRAGVSAFGIGGTNAHVVLEEAPPRQPSGQGREAHLLTLSAQSDASLKNMTSELADFLELKADVNLEDVAYTLQTGRNLFSHRRHLVVTNVQEAVEALRSETLDTRKVHTHFSREKNRPVVFLFPGQGSQYVNMGRDLYEQEAVFRSELDRCFAILNHLGYSHLRNVLYPTGDVAVAEEEMRKTQNAQPLIFAFEYALAKLLLNMGIQPHAMIGYSFGEYVAACFADVFTLEDALKLIVARGNLMQHVPEGAMLSIPLSESKVLPYLTADVSLAVDNGMSCIVAGTVDAIDVLERRMKESRVLCMRVKTVLAGHSLLMDEILEPFEQLVRSVGLCKPQRLYISDITGRWITDQEATDPMYWVRHLRETVRFAAGVEELVKTPNLVFLEVGPGRDLSSLIGRFVDEKKGQNIVDLIRNAQRQVSDSEHLLAKLAWLWAFGVAMDWNAFYKGAVRHRLKLPTYVFDRKRYWIDGSAAESSKALRSQTVTSIGKSKDTKNWGYIPTWRRTADPQEVANHDGGCWLFLTSQASIGQALVERFAKRGESVVTVEPGTQFAVHNDQRIVLNPANTQDYDALLKHLNNSKKRIYRIVHAWSLTAETRTLTPEVVRDAQILGFYSLLYLAQAMDRVPRKHDYEIIVITDGIHLVNGDEVVQAEKATLLGGVMVIPQEYPAIRCRSVDIDHVNRTVWQQKKLLDQLVKELSAPVRDLLVTYRRGARLVQLLEPLTLHRPQDKALQLRERGVYLITGGLGAIGLLFAEYLITRWHAKVVITGRTSFPSAQEWDGLLAILPAKDATSQKIRRLQTMLQNGGDVLVMEADVADEERMRIVVQEAEERFGTLNGVIHAAGIVGKKSFISIQETTPSHVEEQFQAKLYGMLTLESVLRGKELDFCMLMSSLASVLGGLGHIVYSAANLFVDHYVHRHNTEADVRWIGVNWDFWLFEEDDPKQSTYFGKSAKEFAMTTEEGLVVLEALLNGCEDSQVLISTADLQARLDQWIRVESRDEVAHMPHTVSHARPALSNPYVAARDELEQQIASIWESALGFLKIGIEDDFLELGGDSVKVVSVISEFHKQLNADIPLHEFFERSTIKKLSDFIRQNRKSEQYEVIQPIAKQEVYPLSSAQRRLFILNQFDSTSTNYNTPLAMRLDGNLDHARMEAAFTKLIQRHEALRTSFEIFEGQPVQHVYEEVDFEIVTTAADETEIADVITVFIQPYDLGVAPLLRAQLVRTAADVHYLLIDLHHLCSDGLTIEIVKREIAELYEGLELPLLRLQYRDFAAWQTAQLQSDEVKKQEQYWLKRFAGDVPMLNIPTDFPRPTVQSFTGERLKFELDATTVLGLKEAAQRHGATLYMVLLGIYNILLAKYSMQDDVIIGSPIAGRTRSELQGIAGIFVNMLAMRNHPTADKTFAEFLREVKKHALDAYENQEYPFEDLVASLQLERVTNRNPLFESVFVMQNMEEGKVELAGLRLTPYDISIKSSIFELYLQAVERGENVTLWLNFKTALFKRQTVVKMTQRFIEIAAQVAENPDRRIGDISFVHDLVEAKSDVPSIEFDF